LAASSQEVMATRARPCRAVPAGPTIPGQIISAASLLADQQNKSSGSYQQGKQNTGDERNNPMSTGLDFFRSSALLRRSETQPEEKFVHSGQRRHRRCVNQKTKRLRADLRDGLQRLRLGSAIVHFSPSCRRKLSQAGDTLRVRGDRGGNLEPPRVSPRHAHADIAL
jgi:hypothetical protein